MTTTLLEFVIPATVSLFVAAGTMWWTTHSNRTQTNLNLRKAKKEELLSSLYYLKSATTDFKFFVYDGKSSPDRIIEKKELFISRINILLEMYFVCDNLDLHDIPIKTNAFFLNTGNYRHEADRLYSEAIDSIDNAIKEVVGIKA
ncbi:hypothetical protein [Serratia liquefaciens]|uniref:hypothetical protein n=1 Tax=Serratia liquefaciens TaxID=614 RepID=UPI00101F24FB|nr:hypothetical protein [Serratia liquefaciens]RYM69617.1 hypothetical protein BSQ99_17695 [Serratia liquefaciens]